MTGKDFAVDDLMQASWLDDGSSRIPSAVYTDRGIYERELDRIFYGPHWSYVGLEIEVPEAGCFKRTAIGERSVIMIRNRQGDINVLENRCAHRAMRFCQERTGKVKTLVCPYHQWNYNHDGKLLGVPFKNGVKGKGGMLETFKLEDNGLNKLKVAVRNGVVFACFDHDVEPLEDYIGDEVLACFDRTFDGRKLTLLGYSRQRIPGNWKLMMENIKDPYHPGLLHTWFVTFGLWRADNESRLLLDKHARHAAMISRRSASVKDNVEQGVTSFRANMTLHEPLLLDIVHEPWWGEDTVCMTTVFPNVIFQQQVNSVSTRQITPLGPDRFDFVWTHFGFEDDDEEMTERRLRQANLFGPAGFVSADDGEVIEFSQEGFEQDKDFSTLCELDGQGVGSTDHMVTETLIRGMYRYWRGVMEA
ncbi:ring hydroxylating alpha subunit family protein (plasmid) [Blastomonas sp. RAC04]|uniref:aromatic ring-hydroxylating dioxygenase subunit alpha n=1 Tax=Blastomonas sp. RAC04 TaxID=1842535 RepID=UPI00083DA8D2|nr:aromatic ring-hydroxylating dioxygenase subunit alpha [Blastomonas sp. RAC04]AOF98701.1 ring hydroxylating alpha subunit family protein [Blastomonas sp. RAC04]